MDRTLAGFLQATGRVLLLTESLTLNLNSNFCKAIQQEILFSYCWQHLASSHRVTTFSRPHHISDTRLP